MLNTFGDKLKADSAALFKLKYFCQICNRQLQDKDGFNCHLKSETHKFNMEHVAKNPEAYINKFSQEFECGFTDILKRNFPGQLVSVNKIYQEYISDRFAIHLNATKWTSLTGFIKYLERTGKCEVVSTKKDVQIKYIDTSPFGLQQKFVMEKKKKEQKLEEIKLNKALEKISKFESREEENKFKKDNITNSIVNLDDLKKVSIELKGKKTVSKDILELKNNDTKDYESLLNKKRNMDGISKVIDDSDQRKVSEAKRSQDEIVERDIHNINWLREGLIVRVKDKELSNGAFYNEKGKIVKVDEENNFVGELELIQLNKKIKLKLDQAFLEPVIPQIGSNVIILMGKYKNKKAKLVKLFVKDETALISLLEDSVAHESIKVNINLICKIA